MRVMRHGNLLVIEFNREAGQRIFTPSVVADIAAKIGCSDPDKLRGLAEELITIHSHIELWQSRRLDIAPSLVLRELDKIKRNPGRLRKHWTPNPDLLGLDDALAGSIPLRLILFAIASSIDPDNPEGAINDHRAAAALFLAFSEPDVIRAAAERASDDLKRTKQIGRGGNRHERDFAFHETIWNLCRIYIELTGKPPSFSRDLSGSPFGALVDFLGACLWQFGWRRTSEAIASYLHLLRATDPVE